MNEYNKYENTNNFFLDSFSIFENSFESPPHEQNNLDYQDTNREGQKKNNTNIYNNNLDNKIKELNQKENYKQTHKFDIKNNNYISCNIISNKANGNNIYRKDAYYKHFKVVLGKYIKSKINELKNQCFPYYSKNNFSTPNYKYTGNPKEKDNFIFLNFALKDILIYGKNSLNHNRQYNNELLIKFIEKNGHRASDKIAYDKLINFLNYSLEKVIIHFYDDENECNKLKNDSKCIKFDSFFKRETGISLLEKNGFIKAIKKYNTKNEI